MSESVIATDALADELLEKARAASAGRAAKALHTGPDVALKQIVMALAQNAELSEHENPGEATLLVLRGTIVLEVAALATETTLAAGDYTVIPPHPHAVKATDDSVFLLSTALAR